MTKKLKVYAWTGFRVEVSKTPGQTREVCATTSQAKVKELSGTHRSAS